jgi:pimeloyl-ACP methyl ester carboxylesterase
MALAARDYPPYPALKGALGTELFGDGSPRPAPVALPDPRPASPPPLRVSSRADGLALRARLRRAVWGAGALQPPRIAYALDVRTRLELPLAGVARTDELLVRQAYGIDSRIELHVPATPAPRGFVIVHGGHADLEVGMRAVLETLAGAGYVVAAVNMPLTGWNPQPTVRLPGYGTLTLTTHDLLALLPERPDHLLALFLDPVEATVERARRMGFSTVDMVGLSGGGWTTTVSAALDPRIRRSYAVAGSLPTYLRSAPANQGDFEQLGLPFYRLADYQDLYALGALEAGRRQRQIHNDHDPCCFALQSVPPYARSVRDVLARIGGGSFDVQIVGSATHDVGPAALAAIVRDLEAG